jgi:predicted amidophosphoribosyltransferase
VTPAAHESENRHSVDELVQNYEIDEDQTEPTPAHIVIVDDMITAGAHFTAVSRLLHERFPDVPTSGVFLARRIFSDDGQ